MTPPHAPALDALRANPRESVAAAPVPRLRVNFGWTFAGHAVYAACQWATLAVIARLDSAEAVGEYALGTAITAPLFLFAGLHLRAAQATEAARRFRFQDYLGVRLAGMALAIAATAVIAVAS
jgi:O-antigen/teichoic acid export membrane protein